MIRNIVLLSDGTGNSSASQFRTNVWRLYQALDIARPDDDKIPEQIAFYDNGVGTENIKPLALLGGAFGLGVWKNVKDLYTFVCRNHGPGDRIYGFGFSRGAFTIRLLMGLIGRCGIVRTLPQSEAKLLEAVDMAYEAYRRDFLIRASRQRGMIYHHILNEPVYFLDQGRQTNRIKLPEPVDYQSYDAVEFLGVWDTVDAYGMPVDELKIAIDRWVWPMSVADRDPSSSIKVMRHALSLDDERPTFRPVLWNQNVKDPNDPHQQNELSPTTIQQVWFAGVHANVGGGYPDDGMAYVALDWMMSEAEKTCLRFVPEVRRDIASRADTHGEQYDSRAGIAGYYRYGPRRVHELCNDRDNHVDVHPVKVHAAVYDRIALQHVEYAPISLNSPFQLVNARPQQHPTPALLQPNTNFLEQAWDVVWWRRFAYFTTVALTVFAGLFVLRLAFAWPDAILDVTERTLDWPWSWLTGLLGGGAGAKIAQAWNWLLEFVGSFLPDWADKVLPGIRRYPLTAVVTLSLLALLFFKVSETLQRRIDLYAEWAWGAQKELQPELAPRPNWLNAIARPARPITAWFYRIWRMVIANVLGVAIGVVALILWSPVWFPRVFRRRPWMARRGH